MKATTISAALALALGLVATAPALAADGVINQDNQRVQEDKANVQQDNKNIKSANDAIVQDKASSDKAKLAADRKARQEAKRNKAQDKQRLKADRKERAHDEKHP